MIYYGNSRTQSKAVFTLSFWIHKGSQEPWQQVGHNRGKLKSSQSVWATHSSAPTTDLHKIFQLHPKKNHKQACSLHAFPWISWNKSLGTLGSTLGKMKISLEKQTEGPWGHQEQQTRACFRMRNSRLGPLELPLSRRVWKTVETKPKTRKRCDSSRGDFLEPEMVQPPHSPSLKGNQNLSRISGTQCKSPFAPFGPKTAIKNLRVCC